MGDVSAIQSITVSQEWLARVSSEFTFECMVKEGVFDESSE